MRAGVLWVRIDYEELFNYIVIISNELFANCNRTAGG